MNGGIALKRSSTDAAIVAGVLLLVPLRFALIGITSGRSVILLACYAAVGVMAVAATSTSIAVEHAPRAVVAGIGIAAVAVARLLAGPAPTRPVDIIGLGLGVCAAIAEEALFRGLLFRRLEHRGPAVAIGASALLFAAIHVPLYGTFAFFVDLGAGALLGWQRWASGSWGVPAATHAFANVLAVLP